MLTVEQLAQACRKADNATLGKFSKETEDVFKNLGIDWEAVSYVAEQRAIRHTCLTFRGKLPAAWEKIDFKPEEHKFFLESMAASIDGMVVGILAQRSLEGEITEDSAFKRRW